MPLKKALKGHPNEEDETQNKICCLHLTCNLISLLTKFSQKTIWKEECNLYLILNS